jgi:hypothetical protein
MRYNEKKYRKASLMEMIKVRAYVDQDGLLKLEVPTDYQSVEVEVALVMQAILKQSYLPENFFAQLDSIQADDMQERPEQGSFEEREPLE